MNSSRRKIAALAAVLFTVPLIAAGCGGGDSSSETDSGEIQAATTAATLTLNAVNERDPKAMCSSLSPAYIKKEMKSMNKCVKGFRQLLKHADEGVANAELGEVTLDGDRGMAEILTKDGSEQGEIYLVRENGEWHATMEAPPAESPPVE